jgi:hypothetical protein
MAHTEAQGAGKQCHDSDEITLFAAAIEASTPLPDHLEVAPFPAGKEFAVTFVDDTDLSTRQNTEPVYDCLWEHNISGTKTVWISRELRTSSFRRNLETSPRAFSGATLEDEDYLAFVRVLAARGFEIALHNVAAGNSYRDEIQQGLDKFRELFGTDPRLNAFHQCNIENLYGGWHKLDLPPFRWLERLAHRSDYLGHVEGSPYFWGDLARSRITYVRLPFHTIAAVNTLCWNPSMPFHDPRRPYVRYWFGSSDGSDCQRFKMLLSPANIGKLKAERGACVVYTHLAKGFARKRGGSYQLDSGFVEVVRNLAAQRSGWFPTASQLLDRLRMIRQVVVHQHRHEVAVSNLADQPIRALALYAREGIELRDADGNRYRRSSLGTLDVGDLAPHSTRLFSSSLAVKRFSRGGMGGNIPRWERSRLEVLNYIGSLRDWFT